MQCHKFLWWFLIPSLLLVLLCSIVQKEVVNIYVIVSFLYLLSIQFPLQWVPIKCSSLSRQMAETQRKIWSGPDSETLGVYNFLNLNSVSQRIEHH